MSRYSVSRLPASASYGILDTHMWDFCALPDADGVPVRLEWPSSAGAWDWLRRCYRAWSEGLAPEPDRWWPVAADEVSPWSEHQPGRSGRYL